MATVEDLYDGGAVTIVLATRDIDSLPLSTTHVVLMRRGRLVFAGPAAQARIALRLGILHDGRPHTGDSCCRSPALAVR